MKRASDLPHVYYRMGKIDESEAIRVGHVYDASYKEVFGSRESPQRAVVCIARRLVLVQITKQPSIL